MFDDDNWHLFVQGAWVMSSQVFQPMRLELRTWLEFDDVIVVGPCGDSHGRRVPGMKHAIYLNPKR